MTTLAEMRGKRRGMQEELEGHQAKIRSSQASQGTLERVENLHTGIERLDEQIADAEARRSSLLDRSSDPRHREETSTESPHTSVPDEGPSTFVGRGIAEARSAALRAIDARSDVLAARDGDRLEALIRRDASGAEAGYLAAISDPAYQSAFRKKLFAGGPGAVLNPAEGAALQRVGEADQYRSLLAGEGSTGGFAIPIALDPTIILTNAGVKNPLRELATVSTVTATEWRGVSSAGVEAHFRKEGAESEDDAPTLAQPTIKPERADAFIPYSIEAGMDWGGQEAELIRLFAEAKAELEAQKYTLGSGEDEPAGIVTGASKKVKTTGEAAFAVGDVYALKNAVPPGYQDTSTWLSSGTIGDVIYRFVGEGDASEPRLMNEDRDAILGKRYREVSHMETSTASGKKILICGDIARGFRIVDRVGMTVEVVPHLMGENGRPTGMRGLFCFWRTGSKVVNAEALRLLESK